MHISKDERTKSNVKNLQYVCLGYGHDEFGYRLYDLIQRKIVRSRDVAFFENQSIEDIDIFEKMVPSNLDDLVDLYMALLSFEFFELMDENMDLSETYISAWVRKRCFFILYQY